MSKEIPTLGKVWLIFLAVVAAIGIISNFAAVGSGIIYLVSALACVAELVGLVFMLKGKGLPYYCLYGAAYIVNAVLVGIASSNVNASWFIGFIIGVCLNLGLTYLSVKKTLSK